MRHLLRVAILTCTALLHAGCASTPVTLHDAVGSNGSKGFAEFYVGVSGGESVSQCPQCFVSVDQAGAQGNAACGTAMGHAFGGARLRVACAPGAHTFLLSPSFVEGSGSGNPVSVTVSVSEGKVTPVRITVHVLSVTSKTVGYNLTEVTWSYRIDAVAGNPQQPYQVTSMTYRYKDGMRVLWMASTVCTVVVEGKDGRQVQDTKLRLDQAHAGLNMGNRLDREEFKRRYSRKAPNEPLPQGVMIRITTLDGLKWLSAFTLAE